MTFDSGEVIRSDRLYLPTPNLASHSRGALGDGPIGDIPYP